MKRKTTDFERIDLRIKDTFYEMDPDVAKN